MGDSGVLWGDSETGASSTCVSRFHSYKRTLVCQHHSRQEAFLLDTSTDKHPL